MIVKQSSSGPKGGFGDTHSNYEQDIFFLQS